jgi:hypothetical protein
VLCQISVSTVRRNVSDAGCADEPWLAADIVLMTKKYDSDGYCRIPALRAHADREVSLSGWRASGGGRVPRC